MNKITLLGRLTKDVELKLIGDRPLAEFSLAVNRKYKNAQGERETDFFNCKLWGKTAETLQQHTMKGQQLLVSGRVEIRTFTNQEGQNVRSLKSSLKNLTLLRKALIKIKDSTKTDSIKVDIIKADSIRINVDSVQ